MREEIEYEERDVEQEEPDTGEAPEAEAEGGVAGAEASQPGSVEAEVDELRGELASLNDQHMRLAAEFDNYRKRNERERRSLAARLQTDLVVSLLDVLDDLQRVAESEADVSAESVVEGVRMVEKKFTGVLETAGLETIDAEGAPFDPEVMEALMTVPTDDPAKDHHVADVFQRGYRFRDAMIRPARVRVWQYEESE
jgi:molecular chaperone GrpE